MKKIIGIFLIVQTILFGMVIFQLERIYDRIAETAAYVYRKDGTLAMGAGLPEVYYILFVLLIILGIYVLFSKEKNK